MGNLIDTLLQSPRPCTCARDAKTGAVVEHEPHCLLVNRGCMLTNHLHPTNRSASNADSGGYRVSPPLPCACYQLLEDNTDGTEHTQDCLLRHHGCMLTNPSHPSNYNYPKRSAAQNSPHTAPVA